MPGGGPILMPLPIISPGNATEFAPIIGAPPGRGPGGAWANAGASNAQQPPMARREAVCFIWTFLNVVCNQTIFVSTDTTPRKLNRNRAQDS